MKSRFLQGSTLVAALFAASMIATPASAKARKAERESFPWHGWGQSFHHNGVRYPGGNRRGPAMSYNNWEGGFHPTVFWMIKDAERT
jgi:hypothetical protein